MMNATLFSCDKLVPLRELRVTNGHELDLLYDEQMTPDREQVFFSPSLAQQEFALVAHCFVQVPLQSAQVFSGTLQVQNAAALVECHPALMQNGFSLIPDDKKQVQNAFVPVPRGSAPVKNHFEQVQNDFVPGTPYVAPVLPLAVPVFFHSEPASLSKNCFIFIKTNS